MTYKKIVYEGIFNRYGIFALSDNSCLWIPSFRASLQAMLHRTILTIEDENYKLKTREKEEILEKIREKNFNFPTLAAFGSSGAVCKDWNIYNSAIPFNQDENKKNLFNYRYRASNLRGRIFILGLKNNESEFLDWMRSYAKRI